MVGQLEHVFPLVVYLVLGLVLVGINQLGNYITQNRRKFEAMAWAAWTYHNFLAHGIHPVYNEIVRACNRIVTILDLIYLDELFSENLFTFLLEKLLLIFPVILLGW